MSNINIDNRGKQLFYKERKEAHRYPKAHNQKLIDEDILMEWKFSVVTGMK